METSIFLEQEGATPKNKVLDFLIVHQEFDYSLRDIADYARVSYPCIKQLKKELVKDQWIVQTRMVGKAQMYRLNAHNKKVGKFMDFFWTVINEEVERRMQANKSRTPAADKRMKKSNEEDNAQHSSYLQVPLAAKHV